MKLRPTALLLTLLSAFSLLGGCATSTPKDVQPVDNFYTPPYLGTWYEIARLPNRFETGLSHVTATYAARDDGGLNVLNMGYSAEEDFWHQAHGKAYFVGDPKQGHLKVSFFGPFYSSYVIWKLGGNPSDGYRYAFVSGPDKKYLWLLSRTPTLDTKIIDDFVKESAARGFNTEQLEFIEQGKMPPGTRPRPKINTEPVKFP